MYLFSRWQSFCCPRSSSRMRSPSSAPESSPALGMKLENGSPERCVTESGGVCTWKRSSGTRVPRSKVQNSWFILSPGDPKPSCHQKVLRSPSM